MPDVPEGAVRLCPQRRPVADGRRAAPPPRGMAPCEVTSAGSEPADQVNPAVRQVHGRDRHRPSHEFPKKLTTDAVPGRRRRHHHGLW